MYVISTPIKSFEIDIYLWIWPIEETKCTIPHFASELCCSASSGVCLNPDDE